MKNMSEQVVSVEQILQTIRGVINGDNKENTDILELTEIVSDGDEAAAITNKNNEKNINNNTSDNKSDLVTNSNKEESIMNNNEGKPLKDSIRHNVDSQVNSSIDSSKSADDQINNIGHLDQATKSKKNVLLSEETVAETSEALKNLVRTVSKPLSDGLSFRNGTSLEDLIVEILKPYLKDWLDCNLPGIVKHIVEKEVQKLIPKDED